MSFFTNNGKQYVAFVNRSCTSKTTLEIKFDSDAAHVAKDRTESPVEASYIIDEGDIRIFTWK